ncbi:MAG TPA: hypothetical protein VGC37_08545 [Friedmanniella sp.]
MAKPIAHRVAAVARTQPAKRAGSWQLALRVVSSAFVALVALPVVPSQVAVAAADQPPVEFLDTSAAVTHGDPVTVVLVNNTAEQWALTWSSQIVVDGLPVDLAFEAPPAFVEPWSSAVTTVKPPADGTGSGFVQVVAQAAAAPYTVRRPLTVSEPDLAPGIGTWAGRAAHAASATGAKGSPPIPLDAATCPESATGSFWLTTASGAAQFSWTCRVGDETAEIIVAPPTDLGVGSYSGTIAVGTTKVTATYLESQAWWFAIIPLVAGLWLAVALRGQLDDWRPLKQAERMIVGIGQGAITVDAEFEVEAGDQTFSTYTMAQGVQTQLAILNSALRDLPPTWMRSRWWHWIPWGLAGRKEEHQEFLDRVAEVDDLVESWGLLAADLSALQSALDAVEQGGQSGLAPHVVVQVRQLLQPTVVPTPELTFDEAVKVVADTKATTQVLALLPVVGKLSANFERPLDDVDEADQAAFAEARRAFRHAVVELAESTSADDAVEAGVASLVAEARAGLLGIRFLPGVGAALGTEAGPSEEPSVYVGPIQRISAAITAIARFTASGKGSDTFWLVIALGVAVWTGLVAQYFDKPWGLPQDYVAMTAWAFAATTVLTPLLTAVSNLASGVPRSLDATV